MKKFDLIISGGGMVGSISAVAACQSGLSVLLIESNKSPFLTENSDMDLRVSAVSWQNIEYLKKLGIFQNLYSNRIAPYSHMQVWDTRSQAHINFDADFSSQSCLGYLLENNNLVQAAWKSLDSYPTCEIITGHSIDSLENTGSQVRVQLTDGHEFKSRALISAEGRKSKVREFVNIKTTENDYHQFGLVAYLSIKDAPEFTAFQAFNEGGPIGVLPMGDNLFSIVWSLPKDKVDYWLSCDEQTFEQGIVNALSNHEIAPKVTLKSARVAFPLTQLYAERYFNNRVVLCGDSAHGVHPLAGQGVNLGIGDVQLLFELLDSSVLKDDLLLHKNLRKYQRRRISQVKETSEMMSFLHHMFKDDNHIKKPLRSLGMNLINQSPLKKWFMAQAGS
ncbi:MAG TPA: FAD-dependent monooxygenase [Gammaproteobacteria bacterium]|jgi:ubiquinone biosynthesis UbiH/UbiF/VisC/COQ6 family hydroxylase|nr:FAD-dependent monooxygenase [Xanthomonadales bacterium]HPI96509.1 FAD-dependent monooxygenase [Gammaproteobacteria bacterium]HPQ87868.1 FAD-dependent monooxygenase [Gammaproteobacteria bacterium]